MRIGHCSLAQVSDLEKFICSLEKDFEKRNIFIIYIDSNGEGHRKFYIQFVFFSNQFQLLNA